MNWHTAAFACLIVMCTVFSSAISAASADALQAWLQSSAQRALGVAQWPCLYRGKFVQQRSLPGTDAMLSSSGEFLYTCEQGLLWEVHQPLLDTTVYTHVGRHVQIRAGGRLTELDGAVQTRVANLLLGLLGGQAAKLTKDFEPVFDPATPDRVVLQPAQQALAQHLREISLASQGSLLEIKIDAPRSGASQIRINELQTLTQSAVVVCAALSQQADAACRKLFDSQPSVRNK